MILGAFSAFRERLGRQAYPPVIALRLAGAKNLDFLFIYASAIGF